MLELAILGLLKERDMHGYELKKQLESLFGPVSRFSFGSLYPALARLESAGAVATETTPVLVNRREKPRSPKSAEKKAARDKKFPRTRSARARKVYRISKDGEALFYELLTANEVAVTEDDRAFQLRVAFARFLPPNKRMLLFEHRRGTLLERLAESRVALAGTTSSDPYAHALLAHSADSAERDLSWLDSLIAHTAKETT